MNTANKITIVRIILLPVICILMLLAPINGSFFNVWNTELHIGNYHLQYAYLIAGVLFILASLTDFLDGYVARKYNQVTTFGKFFDAIADKLLTNAVLIIFGVAQILPVWLILILILRDFLIDVVRQILASSNVVMAANKLGKYRAAFEMLGLTILFFISYANFSGSDGTGHSGQFNEYGWINQVIMIPMYITTVLSVVSAANYIYLNRKELLKQEK